jgi:hypothetical protein
MTTIPTTTKPGRSRLQSQDPVDAQWRSDQANVDADIEGLARDPEADRLIAAMDGAGVPIAEQIERLKRYFIDRQAALR